MENKYAEISIDDWNRTIRKADNFFNSPARRQTRTHYKGYFVDQITEHKENWEKGIEIAKNEIMTLKLYTDFDKLQNEFKKCFRFDPNRENMDDLITRLQTFYHWRGGLLIVLHKFATKLNTMSDINLYHGVNAKMIIKQSQTVAFNGPLSTSSSYHVARQFATAKGMILKLCSQFPRLNYCNAFDASLISDYPEEREWIVGFMYVRLLQVKTPKLLRTDSYKELIESVPLSSLMRQEFFAICLFKEQIFSMSAHLEQILISYLRVTRFECCDKAKREKYEHQSKQFKDWNIECMASTICGFAHGKGGKRKKKKKKISDDMKRKHNILPIIWKKFDESRNYPNKQQRVKFDVISKGLKRFFMEESEEKEIETSESKWIVSFEEIQSVYPNVKDIHFVNEYMFTDKVLVNLIAHIQKKENTIKRIKFLYWDYKECDANNKPKNSLFFDPDNLTAHLVQRLHDLKWQIKHVINGKTGYKIVVKEA